MKRLMPPAALLIFVCINSLAAPSKHTGTNSTNLSSEVSSALALVPSQVKITDYEVIDKTIEENDQEDIDEYDVTMEGKNFKGDVLYDKDGTMMSYCESIKDTKIPLPVEDAIKAKYPDAIFTKDREMIRKEKDFVDEYKVYFRYGNKHGSALVDSNGDILHSRK